MAHTAHHTNFADSALHILAAPFIAIGKGMVALAESSSRYKQIEQLNAMSDQELADLGLKREDVVRHIFRDCVGF
ncbi:DUF1127 domain-containing protein [uncultured Shimia sp.]|uniref:DUF1127 domain-containing protein n=1 Tax=uncultured Shimia sp. TaxID=573152 RepID=UPI0026147512|nr:DUF1127 domain-containing protein [uncultured Shimia sp.]